LTVHIQVIKMFLVLNVDADDVALNVTEGGNFFVITYCQRHNLILMIVKVLLIVKDITNIAHGLYGTVP
jgi:hypothetical protein